MKSKEDHIVEVITAYKAGKKIEWKHKNSISGLWNELNNSSPNWNFASCKYRIKKSQPSEAEVFIFKNLEIVFHHNPSIEVINDFTLKGWRKAKIKIYFEDEEYNDASI
jgi:hypothetical protein